MLKNSPFYAGFAVDDVDRAKEFYGRTLGVQVIDLGDGLLSLQGGNGYAVVVYEKDTHEPAEHTIVNFPVDDIDVAVDSCAQPAWSSSSTTKGRSQPTRRASRLPARSRRGSRIPPATSCR